MSKRTRDSDDHFSSDRIIAITKEIQSMNASPKERAQVFERKYPEFMDRYPVLFDLACSNDFDEKQFGYMIRLRDQVMCKERTVEDASVEVGQKMFDIYVSDKIRNPKPDSE